MARQAILGGFLNPVYLNETSLLDAIQANIFVDETSTYSVSVSETMTASDTETRGIVYAVSDAETLTASTTQSNTITFAVSCTETLTVSTTQSEIATISYSVSVHESELGVFEDFSKVLGLNKTITETLHVADTENRTSRTVTEILHVTDSVSTGQGFSGVVHERINVQEETSILNILHRTVSETMAVHDTEASVRPTVITETMTVTDHCAIHSIDGNRLRNAPPFKLWPIGHGLIVDGH